VEEVLADGELKYETNVEIVGRYGKPIKIDYRVFGRNVRSSVLTLSAGNPSYAHTQSNELFRRWYDLGEAAVNEQNVTIYEDRINMYKNEDLRRIEDFSIVLPISDRPTIRDVLAA